MTCIVLREKNLVLSTNMVFNRQLKIENSNLIERSGIEKKGLETVGDRPQHQIWAQGTLTL